MQLPCGLDSQIPQEKNIRGDKEGIGNGFAQAGRAMGKQDIGRAFDVRSCAYTDIDTAEPVSSSGDRVYEGEERDIHSPESGRSEKISMEKTSGHEDITYQRWESMKQRFERISRIRKRKRKDWSSWS
mgnify:CR=1 FL=1